MAESSSLSYRRVFHFQLLSTPPYGQSSYFQFQAGERIPEEDFHLSDLACSQAHVPPCRARNLFWVIPRSSDLG
jgi:hypothetical protein